MKELFNLIKNSVCCIETMTINRNDLILVGDIEGGLSIFNLRNNLVIRNYKGISCSSKSKIVKILPLNENKFVTIT